MRTSEPEVILAVLRRALMRGAVPTGDFARRLGALAQELYDRRTQDIESEAGRMLVLAASRRTPGAYGASVRLMPAEVAATVRRVADVF
ncbi:MAG: hypothetical protein C0497_06065 [Gemmatimonas sp.]|nr:hypothetical protein [Gemmatimonas sp.]